MSIARAFAGLLIILVALTSHSVAQDRSVRIETESIKKAKKYLSKLAKLGYSGSVLVAIDGTPVISTGYGYANSEQKIKNSPRTVFDVGSITKQFTAAAILKLEADGKLSTDDRIAKYFPGLPADKSGITIHHLLRHSSGLPGGVGGDFDEVSEKDFIEKVFGSPLRFPAGTRFSYSNVGYSLLALIIEKTSGKTYEEYLYQELWKPAGMEATGYSRPRFDDAAIAVGYTDRERWGKPTEKAWDGDSPFLHLKGNGGILSTTEDLFKWDRALAGDKILSKEAKQKMYFPALRENETGRSHYGYGWDVFKTARGTTRVWHNGTNRVFYADLYRFIDEDVTIILMTNRAQIPFNSTGAAISRMLFEPSFDPNIPVVENDANRALTEQLISVAIESGSAAAIERYKKRPRQSDLLERLMIAKGYDLIDEKKLSEAIHVFALNVFAFPGSANGHDSLAEAYLEAGDKERAIINYKKSLLLDPDNENAREMLKRIEVTVTSPN